MAYERKMSTPPMLLMVYGLLYVLLQSDVTVRLFLLQLLNGRLALIFLYMHGS